MFFLYVTLQPAVNSTFFGMHTKSLYKLHDSDLRGYIPRDPLHASRCAPVLQLSARSPEHDRQTDVQHNISPPPVITDHPDERSCEPRAHCASVLHLSARSPKHGRQTDEQHSISPPSIITDQPDKCSHTHYALSTRWLAASKHEANCPTTRRHEETSNSHHQRHAV